MDNQVTIISDMTEEEFNAYVKGKCKEAKLRKDLIRYKGDLADVEMMLDGHIEDYDLYCDALREKSSIQHSINVTELELEGRLQWVNSIGGKAEGMIIS